MQQRVRTTEPGKLAQNKREKKKKEEEEQRQDLCPNGGRRVHGEG